MRKSMEVMNFTPFVNDLNLWILSQAELKLRVKNLW